MRYNSPLSKPANGRAMFAIDLDGSKHHQVAPWELGGGDHPGFAPDGTILFRSYEDDDTKQSDYWTVRRSGKHLRQLTHFPDGTLVTSASYSPDGKWIAHGTDGVGGNADVFIMRADGTGNRPVTRTSCGTVRLTGALCPDSALRQPRAHHRPAVSAGRGLHARAVHRR